MLSVTTMSPKQLRSIKSFFQRTLLRCIQSKLEADEQTFSKSAFHKIEALFEKENSSVSQFIGSFLTQFEAISHECRWTARKSAHFISHLSNLELIESTMQCLAENLLAEDENWATDPAAELPDVALSMNAEDIREVIFMFEREHLLGEDKRMQIDKRPLRRMDSLSRILSFPARLSPCTSVAVQHDTLYISANVSSDGTQDEMAQYLFSRVEQLQAFIVELHENQHSDNPSDLEHFLDERSQLLAQKIRNESRTSVTQKKLASDISKFVHSIVIDDETFLSQTRNIWLNAPIQVRVLLPHKGDQEVVSLAVYEHGAFSSYCELPEPRHAFKVNHYHAEQMIVYFLQNKTIMDATTENPMLLGISKLCCKTCFDNLKQLPVEVRGTHNQSYQNVEPLIDTNYVLGSPPRGNLQKNPCSPIASPENSHMKPRRRFIEKDRGSPFICRKLDFSIAGRHGLFGGETSEDGDLFSAHHAPCPVASCSF